MSDRPLLTWSYSAAEVVTDDGIVVGPDQLVADAGAEMLRLGGNAVDAAVAGALATAVVEPPMSGIAGGATMTIALRDPDRVAVIDGHMVVPMEAGPEHYPLTGEYPKGAGPGPWSVGFYDWPLVEKRANIVGAKAVATPGATAALCEAQARYGRLRRDQVFAPAVALAADGFPINWYMAAVFAAEARTLARDPACRDVFLPRGAPPRGSFGGPPDIVVQTALAQTLETIGAEGADVFYRGRIGRSIVDTVRARGGILSMADLERYRPVVIEPPPPARFGRFELAGSPTSGFPTMLEALYVYDAAARGERDAAEGEGSHEDAVAWAHALRLAFEDRFAFMSGAPDVTVPWEGLRSREYARDRLAAHLAGAPAPDPHAFAGETAPGDRAPGIAGPVGHTSQVTSVDRDGGMASLTITMQGGFGARLMDRDTGVVLNSGMSYFDPRPGAVNGIYPGAVALSAMTPVVLVEEGRGPVAAIGAAGGRRIVSAIAQIVAALATGRVSMQQAMEAPRIHSESEVVLLDVQWAPDAVPALEAAGYRVELAAEDPATPFFARPNGVAIGDDGRRRSGLEPRKPGGVAIA